MGVVLFEWRWTSTGVISVFICFERVRRGIEKMKETCTGGLMSGGELKEAMLFKEEE